MALPMVHLAVAKALAERDERMLGSGEYYLGAISPDAVHMRPGYHRQLKADSHFTAEKSRQNDPAIWTADVLAAYRGKESDAFAQGYVVHVLTDIVWGQELGGKIFDAYDADPEPAQERSAAYYNDTDLIDIALYKNAPWRPEVFAAMASSPARAFGSLVTEADCEAWRARTLRWYEEHDESMYRPMRYVTQEQIDAFVRAAAERISRILP